MASIKKNFAYNIVLALSQVLFPLVTFPYVTRVLGPKSIGIVSFVDSYTGYFIMIAALGIPIYGVREIARASSSSEHSRIFSEIFSIHAVFTVICILLYFLTLIFYPHLGETYNFFIWGGLMMFSTIFIGEWYFQGIGEFKFIAVRTMLIRLFSVLLLYLFVKDGSDVLNYFLIIVFAVLVNALVNFYYINKRISIKFWFNLKILRTHFSPMFYIFFSRAAVTIFLFLDTIILGFLSSDEKVGIFSTALKVSKIPILIVSSLGVVLIPTLTESFHKGDYVLFNKLIRKSVNFVITASIPIMLFFFSFGGELIYAFAGDQYSSSGEVIKILSPVILIIGLSSIFSMQILMPMGREKEIMISVLIAIGVCLLFNFTLIPLIAEKGAAVTNLSVELVIAAITFYFASLHMKNIIEWKFLFQNIIFSIPSLGGVYLIKYFFENNLVILGVAVIFFSVYFFILNHFIIKNELYSEMISKIRIGISPRKDANHN